MQFASRQQAGFYDFRTATIFMHFTRHNVIGQTNPAAPSKKGSRRHARTPNRSPQKSKHGKSLERIMARWRNCVDAPNTD
jgi:hypothetical protein